MSGPSTDENAAVSALSGFSINNVLEDLSLPSSGLTNRLGISGIPLLDSKQIYNDKYDDEDAVGPELGEDWEAQIDQEMRDEDAADVFGDAQYEETLQKKVKQKRVRVVKRMVERPKSVYERFPSFEKDKILNFSELFKGYTAQKSRLAKRPFHVETVYARKREPPRGFLDSVVGDSVRQVESKRVEAVSSGNVELDLMHAIADRGTTDVPVTVPMEDRAFDLILLSNWEDHIVYEPENLAPKAQLNGTPSNLATTPVNRALESGSWTQSIIWSPRAAFKDFTQLEFNHEDDIIPEERSDATRPRKRFRIDAGVRDKFNLSNDHFYEVAKDKQHRVRQTFGNIAVEHAYPAQKLQLPFYKTRLSKQEARSFHRPALQIPANIELRFSKVRSAKKKKDKAGKKVGRGGNIQEGLRRTGDLSLRDTSNFVLWEYSEEHPPIIPNFGMGSVLVNYYRKKSDRDEHVPKLDLGVPFVLEPGDESPFKKFGYVYPGQHIPTLYNNLIRAPLFRHTPYPTDFLVIKTTTAHSSNNPGSSTSKQDSTKYYLREIKHLFVIGQTFPHTEVPGPHSRKITNTIKHRLQIIAVKLLRKSPGERLKISRLMKYFPDQNELQMRQRLKEFMEYHRRGPHQGFWRLKETWPVPNDADMLKLVTPEQVVLAESMQVGQRHLQDAGYNADDGEGEADDKDSSHLSVEQQLAPWITTKNFLFATQAKAMLRLHGEGDPTGRGEAFSFIRISMKDIFVKAGEDYDAKLAEAENRPKSAHRYNVAEQQQIYKSEIERIWKAQFDSLARKDEPQLSDDERDAKDVKGKGKETPTVPATMPVTAIPPGVMQSALPLLPGFAGSPLAGMLTYLSKLPPGTPIPGFQFPFTYPPIAGAPLTTTSAAFPTAAATFPTSNVSTTYPTASFSSAVLPAATATTLPSTPVPTGTSTPPISTMANLPTATIPTTSLQSPSREGSAAPSIARGDSVARDGSLAPEARNKILRIKRLVDGEWRTEIIREPAVIKAYVRARQMIEEETTLADSLAPTGDADKDKRAKKRLEEEIARMKKNQERRLHRKNAKIVKEGGTPMQLNRPMKPDTTRRCGHCGQMGHMKTNRKCPRWAEFNSGAAPLPATPGPSGLATPGMSVPGAGFGPLPIVAAVNNNFGATPTTPTGPSTPSASASAETAPANPAPKIKLTLKRT